MSPHQQDVPTNHEYDGIHENDNPLPAWWLWTFAGTVVFAVGYWFVMHQWPERVSSFDEYGVAQVEYENKLMGAAVDPATLAAMAKDPAVVGAGKATFEAKCLPCHGAQGQGTVGPNLTDNFWLHGGDLKSIYMTIATGYPKLGMPEWRMVLEDKQLQELVAFVESIRNSNAPGGKPPQGNEYKPN